MQIDSKQVITNVGIIVGGILAIGSIYSLDSLQKSCGPYVPALRDLQGVGGLLWIAEGGMIGAGIFRFINNWMLGVFLGVLFQMVTLVIFMLQTPGWHD